MDGELEKIKNEEATNELETLNSSLNLESEEFPIEEFVRFAGENIANA